MYWYLLALITLSSTFSQNCKDYAKDITKYQGCSNKKIHLTFDDGPNTTTTPKVLETLKRQKVNATFFISTHQLTKGDLKKKKELIKEMFNNNFTVASHGHDHNCHDIRYDWKGNLQKGYTDSQRRNQLSKSIQLLDKFSDNQFSKQKNTLVRFPYGRGISPSKTEIEKMISDGRNIKGSNYREQLNYYRAHSPAMSIASEYKLSHVGWNHDSKDASTIYSKSNKDKYIDQQLNQICKSTSQNIMTLFHDTRSINSLPSKYNTEKTSMDEIIEKAKCLGVKFLSMDEILKEKLSNGVYTKSYSSVDRVQEMLDSIKTISPNISKSCSQVEKLDTSYNSCYSNYVGEVTHCNGVNSYCIDGSWISSKNLYRATCEEGFPIDLAKEISSRYINKSCSKASEKKFIKKGISTCYCQYNAEDELIWKCYDISKPSPKILN